MIKMSRNRKVAAICLAIGVATGTLVIANAIVAPIAHGCLGAACVTNSGFRMAPIAFEACAYLIGFVLLVDSALRLKEFMTSTRAVSGRAWSRVGLEFALGALLASVPVLCGMGMTLICGLPA